MVGPVGFVPTNIVGTINRQAWLAYLLTIQLLPRKSLGVPVTWRDARIAKVSIVTAVKVAVLNSSGT